MGAAAVVTVRILRPTHSFIGSSDSQASCAECSPVESKKLRPHARRQEKNSEDLKFKREKVILPLARWPRTAIVSVYTV